MEEDGKCKSECKCEAVPYSNTLRLNNPTPSHFYPCIRFHLPSSHPPTSSSRTEQKLTLASSQRSSFINGPQRAPLRLPYPWTGDALIKTRKLKTPVPTSLFTRITRRWRQSQTARMKRRLEGATGAQPSSASDNAPCFIWPARPCRFIITKICSIGWSSSEKSSVTCWSAEWRAGDSWLSAGDRSLTHTIPLPGKFSRIWNSGILYRD